MLRDEFYTYLQNPEKLDENSLPHLKEIVEHYPFFGIGWMLFLKNLKILNHPDFDFYLPKGAFYVPDRKKLYNFLMASQAEYEGMVEELKELSKGYVPGVYRLSTEKESTDSLEDLVRSIRDKSALENARKYAKNERSGFKQVDVEFVTETLARIYEKQELYGEAISAYEKLSLKYPEKSVYFASRIEEIKKLMN